MIHKSFYLTALFLISFAISGTAQMKKKIKYYELDIIRGLFYQPYTKDPYTGTAFDEHKNGKKRLEVPIKNGKIEGTVREWEKNGQKVYQAEYVAGVQVNEEWQWYPNGEEKLHLAYNSAGQPHGVCTEWHQKGVKWPKEKIKKSEGLFQNGKEEGEHKWWFDTNVMDQIIVYKNGLIEGTMKNWHPNGQLKLESNYKKGKHEGKTTEWHNNGQKKWEVKYVYDQKDGESPTWSRKGTLLGKQVFNNGKMIKEYNYRSGSIKKLSGFVQVFNKPESFYIVDVVGDRVNESTDNRTIAYSVDGMALTMYDIPVDSVRTSPSMSNKELLEYFMSKEASFVEEDTNFDIQTKSEFGKNKNGLEYLHWYFKSPSSVEEEQKARTVQEEHFISIICNKQILNLYSIVSNSDTHEAVKKMLLRITDTIELRDERIDLNEVARNVK